MNPRGLSEAAREHWAPASERSSERHTRRVLSPLAYVTNRTSSFPEGAAALLEI